ncbi:hypothetical protein [Streptomyces rapamycinicus]|uniref:Uncharacterized protein n=1 Tax=Streptomyces rapamycinicus TaxID=1226757 RepID=A0ABR6LEF4_9ACTN|nr:hypothetical protein [Streptomyces rapamycinicus]AGP53225.1 hypothetical protein M271_08025 [Streptomyces rapamycinicus NRRL 5491]MBB4780711.1 hypothetical protein [Streptomyces rapamycinicus]UTO61413.1 hypothetical protein LJB45_03070 [Streptomyces rapamycinicus]UTP29360.1 hypothetical protein LIV37_08190 [Streptomyces rapamycinicus NRRL 5491]
MLAPLGRQALGEHDQVGVDPGGGGELDGGVGEQVPHGLGREARGFADSWARWCMNPHAESQFVPNAVQIQM